jgi:hypothetical protein
MPELSIPPVQQASEILQEYLKLHPEIGGVRGLAKKANLSYDSVQKYVKGSNPPPLKKWELLWIVINSPITENALGKVGLFDSNMENKHMPTNNPEDNNDNESVVSDYTSEQILPDLTGFARKVDSIRKV